MLNTIDSKTFGALPPFTLENCALGDADCVARNTTRQITGDWNKTVLASIAQANSFIQAWNVGGYPLNWSVLTPIMQALIRGAQGLDQSIVSYLVPSAPGPDGPVVITVPYDTSGPQLPPPPGIPAGPTTSPVPVAVGTQGPPSIYPLSTNYHAATVGAQGVPVGTSALMTAILQLLPGASVLAQLTILQALAAELKAPAA